MASRFRGGSRRGRGGAGARLGSGMRDLPDTGIVQYTGTPLFPEYTLPAFDHLTPDEEVAFESWETLSYGMQDSPYYLEPPKPTKDVSRYTDQLVDRNDKSVVQSLTTVPVEFSFLPEELRQVKDPSMRRTGRRIIKAKTLDAQHLDQLASKAEKSVPDDNAGKGPPEDIDDDDIDDELDELDDQDEDEGDYEHHEDDDSDGVEEEDGEGVM